MHMAQIQAANEGMISLQLGKAGRRASPLAFLPLPLSEDQVVKEAEEVFRSYAFYRYQQEREEGGDEDPEIAQIQQEPSR